MEKPNRTDREDDLMREMAHASLYHWLQREDCNEENLSIGYWQVSRVHAVAGDGPGAVRYAEKCIRVSEELPPFFKGFQSI